MHMEKIQKKLRVRELSSAPLKIEHYMQGQRLERQTS